jgi:hypothetical protein
VLEPLSGAGASVALILRELDGSCTAIGKALTAPVGSIGSYILFTSLSSSSSPAHGNPTTLPSNTTLFRCSQTNKYHKLENINYYKSI